MNRYLASKSENQINVWRMLRFCEFWPWQRKTRAFGEETGSHLQVKRFTPLEFLMYSWKVSWLKKTLDFYARFAKDWERWRKTTSWYLTSINVVGKDELESQRREKRKERLWLWRKRVTFASSCYTRPMPCDRVFPSFYFSSHHDDVENLCYLSRPYIFFLYI